MSKKEQLELLDCLNSAMTLVSTYQKLIDPFLDDYFRGLMPSDIAELAKKSIRLTEENRRLEEALEKIKREIKTYQCDNCEDCYCDICDMKDILDIIKKVKQVKN